jgi:hypothetical protein
VRTHAGDDGEMRIAGHDMHPFTRSDGRNPDVIGRDGRARGAKRDVDLAFEVATSR